MVSINHFFMWLASVGIKTACIAIESVLNPVCFLASGEPRLSNVSRGDENRVDYLLDFLREPLLLTLA